MIPGTFSLTQTQSLHAPPWSSETSRSSKGSQRRSHGSRATVSARRRTSPPRARATPEMAAYVQKLGILKEGNAERHHAPKPAKPFTRTKGTGTQRSNASEHASEHQHARQRDDGRESQR